MDWFVIVFKLGNYEVSAIELFSVLCGIIAVYLAAREKILTWPIGLLNITSAFFIYYQVRLYSDMFLQIYFFGISLYGWMIWKNETSNKIPLKNLHSKQLIQLVLLILITTWMVGYGMQSIHIYFPELFPQAAAYPYLDSWVAISSIAANTLMAKRYIENWILWILIDILCVYLYLQKGIAFIAFEFFIFLILAGYGWWKWRRILQIKNLTIANA